MSTKKFDLEKRAMALDSLQLLSAKDVLKIWPVSRQWLHDKTHAAQDPIPSYKLTPGKQGKRGYRADELRYWLENHRYFPKETPGRPPKEKEIEDERPENTY